MSLYSKRGVSAQKEDVHEAVRNLNQGLFPFAFCKIYDDSLAGDSNYINVMHADGAGTKSILAYLYWKETGDLSVWKGIAQDAVVMNLDDLLCVGIYDNIVFNSTIDRNKNLIPGEVLQQIINGTQEVFDMLKSFGISINYLGGETADVGDVVRTVTVNGTMTSRWEKRKIISNEKINDGDVIVGFASYGKANYETQYNSGIGSNGLTSARHDVLHKKYASVYKESFDNNLPEDIIYAGKHELTEKYADTTIGQMLLSPTRTYAPVLKLLLQNYFDIIHGLIHCSGGGQTKCLKYLHSPFRIIKDNLFAPPPIFKIIQQNSGSSLKEMYEVFNMGCRMELYCNRNNAATIIDIANSFGIDAQIIGRVEAADKKQLIITVNETELIY
ncbi:MAG: phosphoribosylformylglycinamidine cyclo-ligase [Chitinophagaceae bacterium]|jgi:phosphoribosylformylglycinamidine cyclo-ligase|nr:phosphoribosylformylglycinamidine cyclo-ligase [Chitinophagaceae bacterium]MBP6047441.1 phosphoribosylformylglycinamidine cyclo-ligase [Ferruginibacter sp.]NMD28848.1 phosphoribosylformylglycinamidine cyclo-ligase [Bacteroidota bacterium]MBK7346674.1 phosphoribosylformylglycinamidine cyclo-ligase [Chitinophagaceae bacterium]MBK8928462.1 phosphoribosylformylglycinamidine cyclo-ligase [Chitinophagaceae bacterium]